MSMQLDEKMIRIQTMHMEVHAYHHYRFTLEILTATIILKILIFKWLFPVCQYDAIKLQTNFMDFSGIDPDL
jgi:hypothetical protein